GALALAEALVGADDRADRRGVLADPDEPVACGHSCDLAAVAVAEQDDLLARDALALGAADRLLDHRLGPLLAVLGELRPGDGVEVDVEPLVPVDGGAGGGDELGCDLLVLRPRVPCRGAVHAGVGAQEDVAGLRADALHGLAVAADEG